MWFLPFVKTLFRSLGKKSPTYSYPNMPMPKDPLVRGQVGINIDNCIFCDICAKKCPTAALQVDKEGKTWEIERFQCIVCAYCVEVCPKKCLFMCPELSPASETWAKDCVTKNA